MTCLSWLEFAPVILNGPDKQLNALRRRHYILHLASLGSAKMECAKEMPTARNSQPWIRGTPTAWNLAKQGRPLRVASNDSKMRISMRKVKQHQNENE